MKDCNEMLLQVSRENRVVLLLVLRKLVLKKLILIEKHTLKTRPFENVLGKFIRKFTERIFWQNNDQC